MPLGYLRGSGAPDAEFEPLPTCQTASSAVGVTWRLPDSRLMPAQPAQTTIAPSVMIRNNAFILPFSYTPLLNSAPAMVRHSPQLSCT